MSSFVTPSSSNPILLRHERRPLEVYLLGTAHVSRLSPTKTRKLIDTVRPDGIYIELDEERARRLRRSRQGSNSTVASIPSPTFDVVETLNRLMGDPTKLLGTIQETAVSAFLRRFYSAFGRMGFIPGEEFLIAIEEADARGIELVMIDRDARETLELLVRAVSRDAGSVLARFLRGALPEPPHWMSKLMAEESQWSAVDVVDALSREDIREMTRYARQVSPLCVETMLDQRDAIMVQRLRAARGDRVVAIVGAAHLDGIERLWYEGDKAIEQALTTRANEPMETSSSPFPFPFRLPFLPQ